MSAQTPTPGPPLFWYSNSEVRQAGWQSTPRGRQIMAARLDGTARIIDEPEPAYAAPAPAEPPPKPKAEKFYYFDSEVKEPGWMNTDRGRAITAARANGSARVMPSEAAYDPFAEDDDD